MYLRRSLRLSGVIGFLAFPEMGRARRHVAAVSLAVAMFIFEASMIPWERNRWKTNSFLKDYVNLFSSRLLLSNNFSNFCGNFR